MGNKIDLDLEIGLLRDNHGNLNIGNTISCANGKVIKNEKDINIVEGNLAEATLNLLTGHYMTESEPSIVRTVIGHMLQGGSGRQDQKLFTQADIGSLETPLKHICEQAAASGKAK